MSDLILALWWLAAVGCVLYVIGCIVLRREP